MGVVSVSLTMVFKNRDYESEHILILSVIMEAIIEDPLRSSVVRSHFFSLHPMQHPGSRK